jgi:hypothetical protein
MGWETLPPALCVGSTPSTCPEGTLRGLCRLTGGLH